MLTLTQLILYTKLSARAVEYSWASRALVISLQNGFFFMSASCLNDSHHSHSPSRSLAYSGSWEHMHFACTSTEIFFNKWYFFAIITSFISAVDTAPFWQVNRKNRSSFYFFLVGHFCRDAPYSHTVCIQFVLNFFCLMFEYQLRIGFFSLLLFISFD